MANINELAQLVRQMRNAQREYFRTRETECLQRAKELERKVDRMLKEMEEGCGLFG